MSGSAVFLEPLLVAAATKPLLFSPVLPKFDVKIETAEQVSVGKAEIEVDVCAK